MPIANAQPTKIETKKTPFDDSSDSESDNETIPATQDLNISNKNEKTNNIDSMEIDEPSKNIITASSPKPNSIDWDDVLDAPPRDTINRVDAVWQPSPILKSKESVAKRVSFSPTLPPSTVSKVIYFYLYLLYF